MTKLSLNPPLGAWPKHRHLPHTLERVSRQVRFWSHSRCHQTLYYFGNHFIWVSIISTRHLFRSGNAVQWFFIGPIGLEKSVVFWSPNDINFERILTHKGFTELFYGQLKRELLPESTKETNKWRQTQINSQYRNSCRLYSGNNILERLTVSQLAS